MAGDPGVGQEIGSYRLTELLGKGGMGKVYRAEHPAIGKQVAIKMLLPELSQRPDVVMRFFQEAKSVNDIRHENLVDIIDFGETSSGDRYILMEFLEGQTLTKALQKDAPFPLKRIGHMGLQICSALYSAHQKGIVHRDIKSDNVFLTKKAGRPDFIKILDFGIAKLHDTPDELKTQSGAVLGTPLYMSPEQGLGAEVDHLTDLYALGVLFYQMATGKPPFYNESSVALVSMHITSPVTPPSEHAKVDAQLEKVIVKCLEKEKKDRYQTMHELALALGNATGISLDDYFRNNVKPVENISIVPTAPDSFAGVKEKPKSTKKVWIAALLGTLLLMLALVVIFMSGVLDTALKDNSQDQMITSDHSFAKEDGVKLPNVLGEKCRFFHGDDYKRLFFIIDTIPPGAEIYTADNEKKRLCDDETTPFWIGLHDTTKILLKKEGYEPSLITITDEKVKTGVITIRLPKQN